MIYDIRMSEWEKYRKRIQWMRENERERMRKEIGREKGKGK